MLINLQEKKMLKRLTSVLALAMLALAMCLNAFGQETTGSVEITAKDPNGAVIPNATVTIESAGTSAGFRRTVTTDSDGFVRVLQIPPGNYNVTIADVAGFKGRTVTGVGVSLGKTTPVNFDLSTGVAANVNVTAGGEIQPLD